MLVEVVLWSALIRGASYGRCTHGAQLWGASVAESLLDKIESEALAGDVVKALRLCITLGGHSDSAELRDWALRELHGYGADDELPDYRHIGAPLCVDGFTPTAMFTGRSMSVLQLPDFAQGSISERLELRHSIPELLDMASSAEQKGESIRLLPPGATELLLHMNSSGNYGMQFERLYWQVMPTPIKGVVERVCTDIVGLVAEMRSGMARGEDLPSPDVTAQAFSVIVDGTDNRVVLKNVRQESESSSPDESTGHRILKVWAWLATILAAIATVGILYLELAG